MCLANRGKRGGRLRRINVIVSNRNNSVYQALNEPGSHNLVRVPLTGDNKPSQIEVRISNKINDQIRLSKQGIQVYARDKCLLNIPIDTQKPLNNVNVSVLTCNRNATKLTIYQIT